MVIVRIKGTDKLLKDVNKWWIRGTLGQRNQYGDSYEGLKQIQTFSEHFWHCKIVRDDLRQQNCFTEFTAGKKLRAKKSEDILQEYCHLVKRNNVMNKGWLEWSSTENQKVVLINMLQTVYNNRTAFITAFIMLPFGLSEPCQVEHYNTMVLYVMRLHSRVKISFESMFLQHLHIEIHAVKVHVRRWFSLYR